MRATGIVRRIDELGRVVIQGNQKDAANSGGRPVTYNIYSFEGSGIDLQAGGSFETGVG